MKHLFFLAAILQSTSLFAQVPDHIENKNYSPEKGLVMTEDKPSERFSVPEWKKASQIPLPSCTKGTRVWRLLHKSKIEATATKDQNLPVKGGFSRFHAVGQSALNAFKGTGVLDLSSWESGVPARDYRVQKHVFSVEQENKSVVPFTFSLEIWNPKAVDWESPLVLNIVFLGEPISLTFPVRLHSDGKTVRVSSPEAKRFTFLQPSNMGTFAKLMTLCNHKSLASFVDLSLDLQFEPTCK